MKKVVLQLVLIAFVFPIGYSQDVVPEKKTSKEFYLTGGKTFTSFEFIDGNQNIDSSLGFTSGQSFGIGMVFNLNKRHQIRPEINFGEMGANSKFNDSRVTWRLNYLGLHTSYLFRVFDKKRVSISPGVVFGIDYLVSGEQTVGDLRLDVKKEDSFEPIDVNLGLVLNTKVKVTDSFFLFLDYRGQWGVLQIENKDLNETTKNIGHRIMVGVSFKL